MENPAADSVIDVAYWFMDRAQSSNSHLEKDKLLHLLFLSHVNFGIAYKRYLMPSLFVVEERGFIEPNVDKIFSFGKPLAAAVRFDEEVEAFLEKMWKKYANSDAEELAKMVKSNGFYAKNFIKGKKNIINLNSLIENFSNPDNIKHEKNVVNERKILLSQNGPVIVSKWNPRKVDIKGEKYD